METIQAAPNGMSDGGVPSGCILMWSGSVETIPNGWQLCDGTNGTPDLRNRFIVGAGNSYLPGNTGGEASVTLASSQIPPHSHSVSLSISGGSHSHTKVSVGSVTVGGSGVHNVSCASYPSNGGSGSITVSGDTKNTGSGYAHENRPPYYALCFIMKL